VTSAPDEPPALAYIEKTLADSYRKEIDYEENVWRSLPFFAATLALQLAALFQIIDKLPDPTSITGWLSMLLLAAAGSLTLISLGFLAASIYPQRFDYIAKQGALLSYARDLMRDEQAPENQAQDDPFSALVTLKTEVARQYAQATDHNQQINKRRERFRSIAGLAALGSVLMTVFLVGATYAHYLSIRVEKDHGHAALQSIATPAPTGGAGNNPAGQASPPPGASTTSNAGRH
jgi:hypothetical protein